MPAQTVSVSLILNDGLIFFVQTEMSKKNFEFLEIIGQGGFGKVSLRMNLGSSTAILLNGVSFDRSGA